MFIRKYMCRLQSPDETESVSIKLKEILTKLVTKTWAIFLPIYLLRAWYTLYQDCLTLLEVMFVMLPPILPTFKMFPIQKCLNHFLLKSEQTLKEGCKAVDRTVKGILPSSISEPNQETVLLCLDNEDLRPYEREPTQSSSPPQLLSK